MADINEIARAYAKEKGISETQAWAEIRSTFIPKTEVVSLIQSQDRTPQTIQGKEELGEATKVRLRQLEIEEKKLNIELKTQEAALRKAELDEKRLENEKSIAMEKIHQEKAIADRKAELEERRLNNKEDFDQRLQLMNAGKNPEASLEKIYERLFDQKSTHDEKIENLRHEHALELEKLEKSIKEKSSNNDIFDQMKKVKEVEQQMMEATLTSLEAYGVDVTSLRKVAKLQEKEGTIDKLWSLGKKIWKEIEPQAEQAKRELDAAARAPSGLEKTGTGISKEEEERIRKETEEKAKRLEFENTSLEGEKKRLLEQREKRRALEARAIEIGIAFDPAATSDEQLIGAIQQQELLIDQVLQEREKLILKANELGVAVDPSATNEQIFDVVEQAEALRDREKKEKEEEARRIAALHEKEKTELEEVPEKAQPVVAEASPEIKPGAEHIAENKEKPKRKRVKKGEELQKFLITKIVGEEITEIGEIEAKDARGAGLRIANKLGGTQESPVQIKVTQEGSGTESIFNAYSIQKPGKGGSKYDHPIVKSVTGAE